MRAHPGPTIEICSERLNERVVEAFEMGREGQGEE